MNFEQTAGNAGHCTVVFFCFPLTVLCNCILSLQLVMVPFQWNISYYLSKHTKVRRQLSDSDSNSTPVCSTSLHTLWQSSCRCSNCLTDYASRRNNGLSHSVTITTQALCFHSSVICHTMSYISLYVLQNTPRHWVFSDIYRVVHKKATKLHKFIIYWPIFSIFSPAYSDANLQYSDCYRSHHTSTLHYTALGILLFKSRK